MSARGLKFKYFTRNLCSTSSNKFKILFLGQDEFSCAILHRLQSATELWDEIWVATNPDAKTGRRGKHIAVSPLKVLANSQNFPTHAVPKKAVGMRNWEVPGPFSGTPGDPRHVLITASFGRIIPMRILDMFRQSRRFNVHPSLLPLYRGPAPIQHAIADGRDKTGVSVLNLEPMSQGMDSGDLWGTRTVDVKPDATFYSMRRILAEEGGDLLVSTLRSAAKETAIPTPQDSSKATTAPFIRRQFTQINWETWDAHRLDRIYRAAHHQYSLWTLLPYLPYALTLHIEHFTIRSPPAPLHPRLHVPGDSIYDPTTQSIIIRCAGQTEIGVRFLQQENKRVVGASDFWNGVRPESLQNGILKLRSITV